MIPIPKRLLIHSCTLKTPVSEDGYGKTVYSEPVMLEKVRIEPSAAVITDKQNRQRQLSALLLYDCRSSKGLTEFKTEDIVCFNGTEYSVGKIDALYDGKRLHHYEVGLI